MPFKCNICDKGFLYKNEAVSHVETIHGVEKDVARKFVRHTDPNKEKEYVRLKRFYRETDRMEHVKQICLNGKAYPSGKCCCVVCHVERSKSYLVSSNFGNTRICRDCYKNIVSKGYKSVCGKMTYDGNYESNK